MVKVGQLNCVSVFESRRPETKTVVDVSAMLKNDDEAVFHTFCRCECLIHGVQDEERKKKKMECGRARRKFMVEEGEGKKRVVGQK